MADLAPNTKSFRGDFSFDLRVRGSFDEVEAVAAKILTILPHEVITIRQQVGRVKMAPVPSDYGRIVVKQEGER